MQTDIPDAPRDLVSHLETCLTDGPRFYTARVHPGAYHDAKLKLEQKLGLPVISKSSLFDFMHDAFSYRFRMTHGIKKDTPAIAAGALLDCLTLTPHLFFDTYTVVDTEDRRSKAWKDAAAAALNDGRKPILARDFTAAETIAAAAHEKLAARYGSFETQVGVWVRADSLLGIDLASPVILSGMFDVLPCDISMPICDLKTTAADITDTRELNTTAARFGYFIQAAFYTDLATVAGLGSRDFEFLFISPDAVPPRFRFANVFSSDMEFYRKRYAAAVHRYVHCFTADDWGTPLLPDTPLAPPAWDLTSPAPID